MQNLLPRHFKGAKLGLRHLRKSKLQRHSLHPPSPPWLAKQSAQFEYSSHLLGHSSKLFDFEEGGKTLSEMLRGTQDQS